MLLWLALSVLAGPALAGPAAEQHLKAAIEAERALDYDIALTELQQIIADPEATPAQRTQAHYRAGLVCRILDRNVEAEQHLKAALRRDVSLAPPPDASPKVTSFFLTVQESVRAELALAHKLDQAEADRLRAAREQAAAQAGEARSPAQDAAPSVDAPAAAASPSASPAASGGVLGDVLLFGGLGAGALSALVAVSGGISAAGLLLAVVANTDAAASTRNLARYGTFTTAAVAGLAVVVLVASAVTAGVSLVVE